MEAQDIVSRGTGQSIQRPQEALALAGNDTMGEEGSGKLCGLSTTESKASKSPSSLQGKDLLHP